MNNPILEANKLCKTFGSLVAVQDVSIDICKDEIHAVIGPNGAAQTLIVAIFSFIIGIIYEEFIFSNILMEIYSILYAGILSGGFAFEIGRASCRERV